MESTYPVYVSIGGTEPWIESEVNPDANAVLESRPMVTWEEFRATAPPYSLALDGYVDGPPAFSLPDFPLS